MTTNKRGPKKGQVYQKRKPYPVVMCPWCKVVGRGTVMERWHFTRCPHNPDNQPQIDLNGLFEGEV